MECLPTPKAPITYRCHREGIAGNFSSVFETISSDVELAGYYDLLIKNLALFLTRNAKAHDPNNFFLVRSIPGVGKILAMTILYEIHDISRFETVPRTMSGHEQLMTKDVRVVLAGENGGATRRSGWP